MIKKIVASVLILMPTLAFAQEVIEDNAETLKALNPVSENRLAPEDFTTLKKLLDETVDAINASNPALHHHYAKINTDASKIEALKGTWLLSYKVDTTSYTDKLVVDTTETSSDGDINGTGKTYENLSGEGYSTICSYSPSTAFKSDYLCAYKNNGDIIVYVFKFSGDTVTGGYYGTGKSSEDSINNLALKQSPLSGRRDTPTPVGSSDEYNVTTGELSLPAVKVGNDKYSVILSNEGNYVFRLKSAVKK